MKLDRNIFEKLIETNTEAYALLHYQYTVLDTRYNKLENEHRVMHKMLKEAQEKQQTAEDEARMYQAKYEDLSSRVRPASSLYKPMNT